MGENHDTATLAGDSATRATVDRACLERVEQRAERVLDEPPEPEPDDCLHSGVTIGSGAGLDDSDATRYFERMFGAPPLDVRAGAARP